MSFLSFIRSSNVKQAFKSLIAEFQSEVLADIPAHVAAAVPRGWDKVETSVEPAAPAPYVPSNAEKLTALLSNPKFRFRSYNAMIDATGLGTAALDELLVQIGARRAVKHGREVYDSWGLISRVGPGRSGRTAPVGVNPNKAKLVALLSDPAYKFRRYDTLIEKLGIGTAELDSLLSEVEARPIVLAGRVEGDSYGLVSRIGAGPLDESSISDDDDDDFEDESDDYSGDDDED